MFDRDVARLVGISAGDVRDRQMKSGDMEKFPHELDNIVNKLLAFKVVVSNHNLSKNYHVYTVQKLCDDMDVVTDLMAQELVTQVLTYQTSLFHSFSTHVRYEKSCGMLFINLPIRLMMIRIIWKVAV